MTNGERKIKLYLSGGISDVPDYEKRFLEAHNYYKKLGFEVVNPILLSSIVESSNRKPSWNDYMKLDISFLMTCDAIALLPEWEKSKGARLERHIADELSMKIFYFERGEA